MAFWHSFVFLPDLFCDVVNAEAAFLETLDLVSNFVPTDGTGWFMIRCFIACDSLPFKEFLSFNVLLTS